MMTRVDPAAPEAPLTAAEIAADERLEAVLSEELRRESADPFPPDFTARMLSVRPFAPWEVRRLSVWKAPALVLAGLLAASAALFALPLLRLGPGAALPLWAWALAAAAARPAVALVGALRLLPQAGASVQQAIPAGTALLLGAGAAISLLATAFLARRGGAPARAAGH